MARRTKPEPQTKPERSSPKPEGPRLFIAAPLPDSVVDQLSHLIDDLSSRGLPVRWTAPTALHVTLHFIGETPPERAELLRISFANYAPRCGTIRVRTGRLGVFPNEKRPRVLWIGLDGRTDRLKALHRETGALLERISFPIDKRAFQPHLTLGRARDSVDNLFPYLLSEAVASKSVQDIISHPVEFTISDIALYRSHLEKSGAWYEQLASVRL